MKRSFVRLVWTLCILGLFATACARDIYQQRADIIKDRSKSLYSLLRDDRVAGAVAENEQIEGLALEMERGLLRRAMAMDANAKAREWLLIKTANHAAAENWLSIGRYLAETNRVDQAKAVYQRVVETYEPKGGEYAPTVERARRAIKDAAILTPQGSSR
ncbi:MAG: hypothetical protein U0172_11245 [Nitrospiraceae bacterium]